MAAHRSLADIEAEIERTRRELERTLTTIGAVLSAARLLERGFGMVKETGPDKIIHTVEAFVSRLRPEPPGHPTLLEAEPKHTEPERAPAHRATLIGEVLAIGGLLLALYLGKPRPHRP